jgi:hypothetical protein
MYNRKYKIYFKVILLLISNLWIGTLHAQIVKKQRNDLSQKLNPKYSQIQSEIDPNSLAGAEMSYSQVSENEYEISLVKYFYCNADEIDSTEKVSIHETISKIFVTQHTLKLTSNKDTTLLVNINCPNFKRLCVKKVIYNRTIKLMTPMFGGYDVTWAYCCWSETSISNIQGMLESKKQGLGILMHISDVEMGYKNASPVFKYLPILSVCKGQLLLVNNSALDKDNDSLTYQFSSVMNYKTENGVSFKEEPFVEHGKPINKSFAGGQAPFKKIDYKKGFTYSNPLKSKLCSINIKSGEMQLKPDTIGEFLVGVSVMEFRHSKNIGTYQRVYKIKVTD